MKFTVKPARGSAFTLIPDSFISKYMSAANGNYVKIYLYLQMLCQSPALRGGISINGLADNMECTENDVRRALRYWKKHGLLIWTEINGEITEIQLLPEPSALPGEEDETYIGSSPIDYPGNSVPTVDAVEMQSLYYESAQETPSHGQNAQETSSYGQAAQETPSYGQDVQETSSYGQDAQETSSYGQDVQETSSYGQDAQETPSYGQDVQSRRHPAPDARSVMAAGAENALPAKQNYTPLIAEALLKDYEISKTVKRVEQLLGEPVSPAHLQTILYFMCDVGFDFPLLEALYETAVKKGKKQPRYIETIGINWAKKGITTAEAAREEAAQFSGRYALVTRALGIREPLAPVARELIDKWETYGFSDAMVEEACRRAALRVGGGAGSLRYVSGILGEWNKQQIFSTEDLEKSDASFQNKRKRSAKKPASPKNQFQNFPQRQYSGKEYDSLEQKLLKNRNKGSASE